MRRVSTLTTTSSYVRLLQHSLCSCASRAASREPLLWSLGCCLLSLASSYSTNTQNTTHSLCNTNEELISPSKSYTKVEQNSLVCFTAKHKK
ncbi:hypothetical protein EB796_019931 [Bugula neritina]|uniref:Uncharacterized protein n=1 Tax=Bugula neritina TaxID=10212 RepID=A0A7J7J695_BUGNE|nr:hypothetical protein EB796_019931 [Bugula neritina]